MNRQVLFLLVIFTTSVIVSGCSTTRPDPVYPGNPDPHLVTADPQSPQTQLWGFWDVYIDIEGGEVTSNLNRNAMFTANCVNFLNAKPLAMTFDILETPVEPDYIDVDINVNLTHPFPGMQQYNGYDVRGVFMGDGTGSLDYNSDLQYPAAGVDQMMLPDPDDGIGGPDGYTRWFNPSEFLGIMPLLSYTPGKLASPGYKASATICPYKYFADSLGDEEDLWSFLIENPDLEGVFSSGATNTRNYYLRFPTPSPNVKYNYAVVANWEGTESEFHPSNAPEGVCVNVDDSESTVYYVDGSDNGGDIVLDISVWDWDSQVSAGVMEDYTIIVESTVLSSPYIADASDMIPVGGTENYSTYHVEIPANTVSMLDGNEYWVIVECSDMDYTNEFGILNDAWDDPLAAFFRFDLYVSPEGLGPCDVVIDQDSPDMPYEGWPIFVTFDASGSSGATSFEWDFNNDGIFGDPFEAGTDDKPQKLFTETNQEQVCVRTNGPGGEGECCVGVDLIIHPSKNIPIRDEKAWDIALDQTDGRVLVIYDDGTVWQYKLEDWYAQPDPSGPYYDTQWDLLDPQIPGKNFVMTNVFIDITDDQHSIVDFMWSPGVFTARAWFDVIDVNGNFVVRKEPKGGWSYSYTTYEGIAFGDSGPYPNDVASIWGTSTPGSFNYIEKSTGSSNYAAMQYWMNWYTSGPMYGANNYMAGWTRGAETDSDDTHIWTVETTDYYAARWSLGTPGWDQDGIVYSGMYFGTGSQTESDNGFYNPADMTRNSENEYIVFDRLADSSSRFKAFDVASSPGSSIGALAPSGLTGPVLRIDSGDWIDPDFGEYLVVLHGDDTNGYFLSLYLDYELPW